MPRSARHAPGGFVFHALNRGVGRRTIFHKDGDYLAFERILREVLEIEPVRLLACCLMPNHWHMVLWPRQDGQLGRFMQRLGVTHASRWQRHYHEHGLGHLYQGRFKSFPVQADGHFLNVCRYVERNALRAKLVGRAEDWRWGSLWHRQQAEGRQPALLSDWPVAEPARWVDLVNRPQTEAEQEAIRRSVQRGRPYGAEGWCQRVAKRLGLASTLRPRGRPRKEPEGPTSPRNKGS